jgi:flagellar P-ring protein precursor FlgI
MGRRVILVVAFSMMAAAAAFAQSMKDFVEVEGARANKIRGYGIVTGLAGNGDSPKGESARVLRNMLQNLIPPESAVMEINARNAAIVMVTAEIAPFQKKGTRLDVTISAVGDCKSLSGGELQLTDLRGPMGRQDPVIYALASGRLILQGDPRKNNPTTATIPGSAIVEKELVHAFVKDVQIETGKKAETRKAFTLLLKKPDATVASELTVQVNATAVVSAEGRRLNVARAIDGGSIEVRIPTVAEYREVTGSAPPVDFEQEPIRWLEKILNRPVSFLGVESAAVVINDATKAISWTGDVRLREGTILLPPPVQGGRPSVFHAKDGQRLSEFMEKNAPALSDQQLVDAIKALHGAGLIKAEVRSQ